MARILVFFACWIASAAWGAASGVTVSPQRTSVAGGESQVFAVRFFDPLGRPAMGEAASFSNDACGFFANGQFSTLAVTDATGLAQATFTARNQGITCWLTVSAGVWIRFDVLTYSPLNAYLQVTAALSRVEAARAELSTAQTLNQRAVDQQNAGVTPNIDTLRSQVQLQTRQQQLISAQNDYDKSLLQLARTIGLPLAQQFVLSDRVPYQPLPPLDFQAEVQRAYERRPDFQQARALLHAAELSKSAAVAEHYPSLAVQGFYGDEGLNSPVHSHGVFTAQAGLQIPIFAGGRVRADIEEADATLKLRRAALEDLKTRIEYEIRSAFLDVQSAAKLVEATQTNMNLAAETLRQAQDRFSAGVADNLEVVQAQDSVAAANDGYIAAVYQHNPAKVFRVRSVGVAEEAVQRYLKGTGK